MLTNVEAELETINATVKQLKDKSPEEIEKELRTLFIDTEKKLKYANKVHVTFILLILTMVLSIHILGNRFFMLCCRINPGLK